MTVYSVIKAKWLFSPGEWLYFNTKIIKEPQIESCGFAARSQFAHPSPNFG
jgi:hypothetical protein